jgi:hypothetical protein
MQYAAELGDTQKVLTLGRIVCNRVVRDMTWTAEAYESCGHTGKEDAERIRAEIDAFKRRWWRFREPGSSDAIDFRLSAFEAGGEFKDEDETK